MLIRTCPLYKRPGPGLWNAQARALQSSGETHELGHGL